MNWLWTWGGSSFGYHETGELWTYDGRHVGRFQGKEVYDPAGLYLGEVMNDERLIVDSAKTSLRRTSFSPLPDSTEHPPVVGFNRIALPDGYEDFPRPARLR